MTGGDLDAETALALVQRGAVALEDLLDSRRTRTRAGGQGPPLSELLRAAGLVSADELAAAKEQAASWSGEGAAWGPEDELLIAGRYRVRRQLGAGGMGAVFLAHDPVVGREVALKTMRPDRISPARLTRFAREAQAIARLRHPGIVEVYDVMPRAQPPYLVMAKVEGGDLEERLPRASRAELIDWIAQVARALAHAHARGIVHRDVKPANVLIDRSGRAVVTDFGLALQLGEDEPVEEGSETPTHVAPQRLTAAGSLIGTPAYMSPEQAQGLQELTPATDVFSLGVLLYEALSGQRPFHGQHLLELMQRIAHSEPPPLASRVPDVPAGLGELCARCLAKQPEARPGAAEVAEVLEGFVAPAGLPAPAPARRGRQGLLACCLLLAGFACTCLVGIVFSSLSLVTATARSGPAALQANPVVREHLGTLSECVLDDAASRAAGGSLFVFQLEGDKGRGRVTGVFSEFFDPEDEWVGLDYCYLEQGELLLEDGRRFQLTPNVGPEGPR